MARARQTAVPAVRADRQPLVDAVVAEVPLRVMVAARRGDPVAAWTTLRTPGADLDLALGWAVAEGLVATLDDVVDVHHCPGPDAAAADPDAVTVRLARTELPDLTATRAHTGATAACGLCGRTELEDLVHRHPPVGRADVQVDLGVLRRLAAGLRADQPLFAQTGGSHAAATATADGTLLAVREDVGRHNAVDAAVGATVRARLRADVLVLSGRAGYELVAKAAAARIAVVVAVGATTDLARSAADAAGITLVAFVTRDHGGTVLSRPERLGLGTAPRSDLVQDTGAAR